jgi:hypothetical protein
MRHITLLDYGYGTVIFSALELSEYCGRDMYGNILSIREAVKYRICISSWRANG